MIHDLHAFCCQLAPSVWFWELWHSGSCEWNSNNVIVDVADTPDDAGSVGKSGPSRTVQHGVIWSATKHDKNTFIKPLQFLIKREHDMNKQQPKKKHIFYTESIYLGVCCDYKIKNQACHLIWRHLYLKLC